jgi:hypothetical protein
MALQFVKRDGRIFMIFEAGLAERLIEIAVIEPGKHDRRADPESEGVYRQD